jgi:aminoacrylate hydrolase
VNSLQYEILGSSKQGAATIVLSAGLGGAGAFWQPQIAALREHVQVLLYDHRGTGSNRCELQEPYSIRMMADDVLEILDKAGLHQCHFMGHALGGLVGLDLALRTPSPLSSLILVNAWAKVDNHTKRCFTARTALLSHVGPEAYVRAQPIFLYPASWLSQHEDAIVREEAHGIAHFQGAHNLMTRLAALLAFDVSYRLGDIPVPTLVAASRDDILVPYTASEALAAAIPGAKLWLTAEGGHACTVTDPAPFNQAAIDFLLTANSHLS